MQTFINRFNTSESIYRTAKNGFSEEKKARISFYTDERVVTGAVQAFIHKRIEATTMPVFALLDVLTSGANVFNFCASATLKDRLLDFAHSIKFLFISIITLPLVIYDPNLIYKSKGAWEKELDKSIQRLLKEEFEKDPENTLSRLFDSIGIKREQYEPLIKSLLNLGNDTYAKRANNIKKEIANFGKLIKQNEIDKQKQINRKNKFGEYLAKKLKIEKSNPAFLSVLEKIEALDPNQVNFNAKLENVLVELNNINPLTQEIKNLVQDYIGNSYQNYLRIKNKRIDRAAHPDQWWFYIATIVCLDPYDASNKDLKNKVVQYASTTLNDAEKYKQAASNGFEDLFKLFDGGLNEKTKKRIQKLLTHNEFVCSREYRKIDSLDLEQAKNGFINSVKKVLHVADNSFNDTISKLLVNQENSEIDQLAKYDFKAPSVLNRREALELIKIVVSDVVFNRVNVSKINEATISVLQSLLEIRSPLLKESIWNLLRKHPATNTYSNDAYENVLGYLVDIISHNPEEKIALLEFGKSKEIFKDKESQKKWLIILYKLSQANYSSSVKSSLLTVLMGSNKHELDLFSTLLTIADEEDIKVVLCNGTSDILKSLFSKILPNIDEEGAKVLASFRDPKAFLMFKKKIAQAKERHAIEECFEEVLESIIKGKFREYRHDTNHLKEFDSKVVEKWMEPISFKIKDLVPNTSLAELSVFETEDPIDLLTCDVYLKKCLSLEGRVSKMKGLISILADGKYHTIVIHNPKMDVIAEAQMVLLQGKETGKPIILLEEISSNQNEELRVAILELAKRKAMLMNADLVRVVAGVNTPKLDETIESHSSNSPIEYIEHKLGNFKSPYSVKHTYVYQAAS